MKSCKDCGETDIIKFPKLKTLPSGNLYQEPLCRKCKYQASKRSREELMENLKVKPVDPAIRQCLECNGMFQSASKGNRLCNFCKLERADEY